jgi:hypothetical protein
MNPVPQISRVAIAAGLPARYLYWVGRSGKRYLFTCTGGAAAVTDFDSGIAIAVASGEIVWIGEVAMLSRMPQGARPRRAEVYLHFLAKTPAERRAIIDDLRPERQPMRLAA